MKHTEGVRKYLCLQSQTEIDKEYSDEKWKEIIRAYESKKYEQMSSERFQMSV